MLYLVNVSVKEEVATEWATWMRDVHIKEVVDTGCFHDAIMTRDEEHDREGSQAWVMIYRARSKEDFARYERDHAPALKADHATRYAGMVEASRQILPIYGRYATS